MTQRIIDNEMVLQAVIGDLRQMFAESKYLRMTVKSGRTRSVDQNAISHAWYGQIARELREDDELGWKCYCKLHHGVPILRAEDDDFRGSYDAAIKGLTYEQKLKVMRLLPVSSLMTKAQLSKYLEAVQADFVGRGVMLSFPEAA
ncbi:hypothetical protein IP90_00969 [Luteimonas cucumeris]|uniref:NinB protein n=1 Tax=Luteimonas cucumeris TaxID=985012 RepID=A0A562LB22_9GAMM|nr:hypothetical protein [Luteimonas cucumeris]TWI04831.1 hypothetical protein IP90_00969 [Luteimonas cucumeris]